MNATTNADKKVERKISWYLYVFAFIIASTLFSVGVYVGMMINQNAMSRIDNDISAINEQVSTMGLLLLLEENNSAFCPVYKSELAKIDGMREKLGYELSLMEEQRGFSSPAVKNDYMVLQGQSYLLSKKIKELCAEDKNVFVLFFYDNKNCSDCKQQGDNILRARDSAKNKEFIRIYAFDGGIESAIVEAFEKQLNIIAHPTTIIGSERYVGAISENDLRKAMENAD